MTSQRYTYRKLSSLSPNDIKEPKKVTPGVLSHVAVKWMDDILDKAATRTLNESDLCSTNELLPGSEIVESAYQLWSREAQTSKSKNGRPSLLRVLRRLATITDYCLISLGVVFQCVLEIAGIVLLYFLLKSLMGRGKQASPWLYMFIFAMFFNSIIQLLLRNVVGYRLSLLGSHLRSAAVGIVYRKV